MRQVAELSHELIDRFRAAVTEVERSHGMNRKRNLADGNVEKNVRDWLNGDDDPLPWSGTHITPDEFFFVTTLYGNMTEDQQRTMIRNFFCPLFGGLGGLGG
jgi:hypothetical protein